MVVEVEEVAVHVVVVAVQGDPVRVCQWNHQGFDCWGWGVAVRLPLENNRSSPKAPWPGGLTPGVGGRLGWACFLYMRYFEPIPGVGSILTIYG